MTRQIDIRTVQKLYGDKVNPVAEFFKSIPTRFLIIAGAVVAVALILFIVLAIVVTRPEKVEQVIRKDGEIVDITEPEPEKTFADVVEETKDLSPAFVPIEGPLVKDGNIVAVADNIGIQYDSEKIADIKDAENTASPFVKKLYNAVSNHADNLGKPITFLFADSLPMSVVYRIMYTFATTSRKPLIGGPTHNGIATFDIIPCNWPDHDTYVFRDCKSVPIEVKITKKSVIMRRVTDVDSIPLVLLPDGTELSELKADIVGRKVQFDTLSPAISRLRSFQNSVYIVTDGDVSFGTFIDIARHIYGSPDNPNVKQLFVSQIPLM